jgi:uncharacterized protein (DUF2267 family)
MDIRLSATELLENCMDQGIPDGAAARRALHATLATVASRLTEDESAALASALPAELARIVQQAEYDSDFDAPELYLRVGNLTSSSLGVAREQVDVVLRVIGQVLSEDVRRRISRALPEPIARVLEGPVLGEPPPHPTTSHAPRLSTLATGRPGSHHPVSESAPSPGQTHSVARSDDPHADTKLSSARGVTQERLGDTLAEGEGPSPERPVSEASDD